jgi:hypothetical protein
LIPTFQPLKDGAYQSARKKNSTSAPVKAGVATPVKRLNQPVKGRILTQHTGLPPRVTGTAINKVRKPNTPR